MPDTLRINEIFWSFQGEGCRFGVPSVFVRLSGCSLCCPYCDTPDSWQNEGEALTVAQVMDRVRSLSRARPGSQLVITGGEPLEQDLSRLVAAAQQQGYFIAIETNGAHGSDLPIDWWAVSPKYEQGFIVHPGLHSRIGEIKLVVTDRLTLDVIRRLRTQIPTVSIFLQPDVHNQGLSAYARVMKLYELALGDGVSGLRVGMQLHRVYGVR